MGDRSSHSVPDCGCVAVVPAGLRPLDGPTVSTGGSLRMTDGRVVDFLQSNARRLLTILDQCDSERAIFAWLCRYAELHSTTARRHNRQKYPKA